MRKFTVAFFLLLLTMISGCASSASNENQVLRPEFSYDRLHGQDRVLVKTDYMNEEFLKATIFSISNDQVVDLSTPLIGGRVGGGSYLYAITVPSSVVDSMGGESVVTISAGMRDNGVVLRKYYVKWNLFFEFNPNSSSDLAKVRKTYKDF